MSGLTEGAIQLSSGKLSYVERAGTAADPPLIFVHGFLDSWKAWSKILPEVAPDRSVFAISLRGWGDSEKVGEYSINAYAADVADFMDVMNISKAVICGHSMGTIIATAVAARNHERVARLVLCGAAATLDPEMIIDPDNNVKVSDLVPPLFDQPVSTCGELDKEARDFLMEFQDSPEDSLTMTETFKADPRAVRDSWNDMLTENHCDELPNIDVAVLILWGTEDELFTRIVQQRLTELLKSCELIEIPGVGHDGVIGDDTAAAAVVEHTNRWLGH